MRKREGREGEREVGGENIFQLSNNTLRHYPDSLTVPSLTDGDT